MAADSRQHDLDGLKVVILAGGYGTRLAERTDELPKPMIEVGRLPILWHILKTYSHFHVNDFLIACGYKSEAIKRFFLEYRLHCSDLMIDYAEGRVDRLGENLDPWRVGIFDTGLDTMTGGRLRRLAPYLDDQTFLMTYGDGLCDVNIPHLLGFHRDHGRLATFTAVHPPPRFGRPKLEGNRVVAFDEKPDGQEDWINGGYFVLEPAVLDYIDGDETSFEFESLRRLAADGELMAYRHDGFWHPMDTLRDVRNLNRLWAAGDAPWKVWE